MSSYRRNGATQRQGHTELPSAPPDSEYTNPGTERSIYTGRLTSGLAYQRPVDEKEVDRLIRDWDEQLPDYHTTFHHGQKFILG